MYVWPGLVPCYPWLTSSGLECSVLAEPVVDDFSWDRFSLQRDSWLSNPSNTSPTMIPFDTKPADDFFGSSIHAESWGSETAPQMECQQDIHLCDSAIKPRQTNPKLRLPATCLLRTRYDGLQASLSEVIGQDASFATRASLPTKETLNSFIEMYFEHFSPLFPVLSPAAFIADTEHYLLVLCVCTIGVSFLAETKLQALYLMRSLLRKGLDSCASLAQALSYCEADLCTGWKRNRASS